MTLSLRVVGVAIALLLTLPAAAQSIRVVDGDTVRVGRETVRLVGLNAPETGSQAMCERERTLAAAATRRLRQLVAGGGVDLQRVACACRPGTEGTQACNWGRRCAVLWVRGRDVADILVSEGLAERYVCQGTRCPPRRGWCG